MRIAGLNKFTLIDFPGAVSAVVFTQGCPWRCHFCHNPELVDPERFCSLISEEAVFAFLETRKGKLDGVVVSGGEPTLQKDLLSFMEKVKAMGFLVKLDTSGVRPEVLQLVLQNNLADYVAMDIKAPLDRYQEVTNVAVSKETIQKSVDLLLKSKISYEFRSTLVREIHSLDDVVLMAQSIQGAKRYALQRFSKTKVVNPLFVDSSTYTEQELEVLRPRLAQYVSELIIR